MDKILLFVGVVAAIGLAVSGTLVAHPPKWLVTSHHTVEVR